MNESIDKIIKELKDWRSPNNPDKIFSTNQLVAVRKAIQNEVARLINEVRK